MEYISLPRDILLFLIHTILRQPQEYTKHFRQKILNIQFLQVNSFFQFGILVVRGYFIRGE